MTGRGIDQILPHPSIPRLYEPYVTDARDYVSLAERANGAIPKPAGYDYIWGEALRMLDAASPDLRIINLETAITTSDAYWRGKGINYRMHPDNIACLQSAGIDCCVLANNHVLDWGYRGLDDTLTALHRAGIATAGAGTDRNEAWQPAILPVSGKGRVLVFSVGHTSSGPPPEWAATSRRSGIALLEKLSEETVQRIAAQVEAYKTAGDIVIVSIHWGGNWGYAVPAEQRRFAHQLIDEAAVDIVHGHSSHHAKGIEVYRERPIIYGCGDLLNDYEGIGGYEAYRDDLGLMYLPSLDPATGQLQRFELLPTRICRFRLERPPQQDRHWLMTMLKREGEAFGTQVIAVAEGRLALQW
jgi:poly-gamma-glutamate synthesis protein (capsule biosynthesis protein)